MVPASLSSRNFSAEFQKCFPSLLGFLLVPPKQFSANKRYHGDLKPYEPIIFKWHIRNSSQCSDEGPHTYTRAWREWTDLGQKFASDFASWTSRASGEESENCFSSLSEWREKERECTLMNIFKIYACHWRLDGTEKAVGKVTGDVTEWRLSAFRGSLSEKEICSGVGTGEREREMRCILGQTSGIYVTCHMSWLAATKCTVI